MLIVGTAGHIDHGKTSLVGALTGISTDRLKEEQARGISIELGFAYIDLAGTRCGIVDVPGHERFIRQMIAGATGIDLVMLVVAADEGVMQQTREHLDVCRLLGITRGFVVLTKTDLVDADWMELVESDIATFVRGTFLEGAPIVRSAAAAGGVATAGGVAAVRAELERQAALSLEAGRAARAELPFRLPVDRVFTLRGFGTVVTGTVASGRVAAGDNAVLLPGGRAAKIRGIESHGRSVDVAHSGMRAALNLPGLDKDQVERGEVVAHAGALASSHLLDVDLEILGHIGKFVENQAKALVHVGTAQVTGTVILLDAEVAEPGETRPAQLRLDRPVVALGGDRVVLRGFEQFEHYGTTFAGGRVLHPTPMKHRANDASVLEALACLRSGAGAAAVALRVAGVDGLSVDAVAQVLGVPRGAADDALSSLIGAGQAFEVVLDGQRRVIDGPAFEGLLQRALDRLAAYHVAWPHRLGMPRAELRTQVRADLSPKVFTELLLVLERRNAVAADTGSRARLSTFRPTLGPVLERARAAVLERLDLTGYSTPSDEELVADTPGVGAADVKEVLDLLIDEGLVVKLEGNLLFHRRHLDRLVVEVTAWIRERGELSTPELKELTQASRKYTVPLGEWLDATRVTARFGDVRRLRGTA